MRRGVSGVLACAVVAAALIAAPSALAAAPPNDNADHAQTVPVLPFSVAPNTRDATTGNFDPYPTCDMNARDHTVWYSITLTQRQMVSIDPTEANGDMTTSVYSGGYGSLLPVGCERSSDEVVFTASAGVRYLVMLSATGEGGDWPVWFETVPFPSKLVVKAKSRVKSGQTARIVATLQNVDLADITNRDVTIYRRSQVTGGSPTRIASGEFNAEGKFETIVRPKKTGWYYAEWAGETRYKPSKSSRARVAVESTTKVTMKGARGRSGQDVLYRKGDSPLIFGKTSPSHPGRELKFHVTVRFGGGWVTVARFAFKTGAGGGVRVRLLNPPAGRYRVRAQFRGDTANLASTSPWTYFRVTK